MVDASMTVSSIAVGPSADAELLTNIAKWGKGRGYAVLDAKEVTQIFVKEARNAMSAFDEGEAIAPVVRARSVLSTVDLSDMPALRGRTAVVLKDAATEVLGTETDDPLLAFWPFGLGRTAVFASDVKDRWASAWVRWRGYGPFFSAVVRAVARQRPEPLALSVMPGVVRDGTPHDCVLGRGARRTGPLSRPAAAVDQRAGRRRIVGDGRRATSRPWPV